MNHLRLLLLSIVAAAGAARAQQPTPPALPLPGAPGITMSPFDSASRARRDNYVRDTTADTLHAPKTLVKWADPDSVMQALMDKKGYTVTRYQGNRVELMAGQRDLQLDGRGAIERGQTILVADTIFYSDSLKMMKASAPPLDTIFLRDPSQGTADMLAHGYLDYDLATHCGLAGSLATNTRQAGNTWYVYGHQAAVVGDTTGQGHNTSFALDGSITSCDLTEPHYHFQATEIKVVSKTIMVARPAVLYVADVPVLWLPFIFQDMRQGRRSGILTPRFGIADIIRTTPTYVRQIENVGYYFDMNDYMDALLALSWRSGAGQPDNQPGWTRLDGQYRFRILDRFISSNIRASYTTYTNGANSFDGSFQLAQQFNQNSTINANLNYSSSTSLYRYQAVTVAQALAAITSQLAYQDRLGPFALSVGGSRSQYAGQDEVDTNFPNFSLSSQPITVVPGVLWSPAVTVSNTMNDHLRGFGYNYNLAATDSVDSLLANASQRLTSFDVNTPFRFGNFSLPLDFKVTDVEKDLEQNYLIYDFNTGKLLGQRTYARTFRTDANFETGVALPAFFGSSWNITPFVAFVNADPSAGYWVRTRTDRRRLGRAIEDRADRHWRAAHVLRVLPRVRSVRAHPPLDPTAAGVHVLARHERERRIPQGAEPDPVRLSWRAHARGGHAAAAQHHRGEAQAERRRHHDEHHRRRQDQAPEFRHLGADIRLRDRPQDRTRHHHAGAELERAERSAAGFPGLRRVFAVLRRSDQ